MKVAKKIEIYKERSGLSQFRPKLLDELERNSQWTRQRGGNDTKEERENFEYVYTKQAE